MKINRIFLYGAALFLAAACGKEAVTPEGGNEGEVVTPAPEYAVSFTAYTENASDSKATIGTNTSGNLQTFWEDGDEISVYSSNYAVSDNTRQSYKFTTALTENSTSATFGYVGEEEFAEGNYFAVYPYFKDNKAVNYEQFRMDKFDVPEAQTLVAGGFDRSAMFMTAYSENLDELHFKNVVALVKFKVADDDVISGVIDAVGDLISGRFLAEIDQETLEPSLSEYNENTTYNYVTFSAEDSAPLTAGVEYYVAVRPTELSSGFHIYLNDVLVKSYPTVEAFERNKIYDLGTLTIPENQGDEPACTKILSFDFTEKAAASQTDESWPTATRSKKNGDNISDVECNYNLEGVNYSFLCADYTDKTAAKTYWNKTEGYVVVSGKGRYLGLPVLEGYKLVKVVCLHGTSDKADGRGLAVTSEIISSNETQTYVSGGEPKVTTTTGDYLTYELKRTYEGTRYYLTGYETAIGLSNITLTYEQVK